ncbi:rho GTPase-activating protein 23-like [Seriola lalandi dorsalis]|uniref:rho GTPase-activating protein 23-like n=1 Tax=Seriola lalandi dorsalis TaxID=1841481 RepID=UPI000C6F7AB9|nr:rho GTPase-activating protein 23-like [Seriola lalandi dorsalis]
MWAVRDADLSKLRAPMPAAMLPCPAPAGSDWSFQNPVGVDCSSPEPRCIWLAVLRGTTGPAPPPSPPAAMPTGQSKSSHQPRAKGRRDGLSSAGDNPRPPMATRSGREGGGVGWKGPRTLVLHKNSQGFGFTLRHFIVYPPESALHTNLKDEENGNGKGYQKGRLEPMDTIFVKNVREKGPAHQAGLCTGDRLVKVNGESVLGKTYSQVIALIQNSESVLELSIMPKDEDVLQLAYSQDAYLTGNEPYSGGAENLPPPPPLCYSRTKTTPPAGAPPSAPMGQNQLDNWSRWPGSSSPSSPLDNRSAVGSPASWQEGRAGEPGGVGHTSPAHRTEEIQYGMTSQQPQGQTRGRSYSSSSSSGGPLSSPLQVHYPNHHASSSQSQPRKSSSAWTSPPPPQLSHGRTERCQQALSDWYYSQLPEHSGRCMQTRHRSYSQDRLSETRRQQQRTGGWPHSASQDTLLLLQQSGPGPHGEPCWSYADLEGGPGRGHPASNYTRTRSENLLAQYDRHGRSLEMLDRAAGGLVSPRFERPSWLQQAPQPPPRTDAYPRQGSHYGAAQAPPMSRHTQSHSKHHPQQHTQAHSQTQTQAQQAAPQTRRLPPGQSMDDQPVGYRSYSPSFYRKTGRIMQQAHSFRDPSYSGPHLNWNPTPKTSPPEVSAAPLTSSTASPLASATPESQDRAYRPTNHERERGSVEGQPEVAPQTQEVVLRQKPPTGRRNAHGLRHPHYALPMDGLEPSLFSSDPQDSAPASGSTGDVASHKPNGNLAPLPIEDDSLASIPFIDEPTSPGADLRARHVPASSVVSSGMSSAPAVAASPASPTFHFPLTRLFSHDCSSIKSSRRSSYLLAITTERSKSCDEGLNTFREEGRVFSRLPKRVKSFFTDGSLDNLGTAEEVRSKRHSTSELGNITYSDVRREGWLHFKQILTEKGKKVGSGMRPWKRVFSVLRSHSLFLYKDKREAVLRGATIGGAAEDEQPISIRGCLVDIAYSETKRKHALRLTTQDFCEYLLQAEDREDMLDWIKVIRENSKTDTCGAATAVGWELPWQYSTNSDSAKSKGSWGSKKDLTAKDFLTLSIMSAVTGRKRRKRHNARRVGSSTDDDSEHEPIKAGHLGAEEEEEAESPVGDTAPRAEGEEDDDEEEEEEEEEDEEVVESGAKEEVEEEAVAVIPSRPCCKEEEEAGGRQAAMLLQEEEARAEVKGPPWRAPEDARSIVSGYSTLSTLGRSLGSEGRGDDADDEHSELVSETDNESGFASRSLTQERPNKHPTSPVNTQPPAAPRSFLYTHYKPPVLSPTNLLAPPTPLTHTPDSAERSEGGARSTTPSSSSFSSSSTTHRLHSRPSFNSHKLIQCDTLARKKLKSEKTKARSLDLLELPGTTAQGDEAGSGSDGAPRVRRETSRTNPSSGSSQESLRLTRPKPALPPSEAASFTPTGPGGRSLAEQVRARLLGSADDLRSVGLRKPLSPETRRKRRAWRRHTVVASPTETSEKRPPLTVNEFPLSPFKQNQVKTPGLPRDADGLEQGPATRQAPTSRFHQYL